MNKAKRRPSGTFELVGHEIIVNGKTAKEVSEQMGMSLESVYGFVQKYKRFHEIAQGEKQTNPFPKELMDEWDRVRFILNPNAKREAE